MLLNIVIALLILIYIFDLERTKCDCSKNWKRDYVKYGAMVVILFSLIMTIINLTNKNIKKNKLFIMISSILALYLFSYTIISIIYFLDLQKKLDCECSKDWKRYALIGPLIAIIILMTIVVIVVTLARLSPNNFYKISKKMGIKPMHYDAPTNFPTAKPLRTRRK